MKLHNIKRNSGFTIIEAIAAIFILTISVLAMLNLTASSSSSARYANNELTANYLLQEGIDSIRSSRDTIAFLRKNTGGGWTAFKNRYGAAGGSKCFSSGGCILMIEDFDASDTTGDDVVTCVSSCEPLQYDNTAESSLFYKYSGGVASSFVRKVNMVDYGDGIKITVTMNWLNGTTPRSQSLTTYLYNWQE